MVKYFEGFKIGEEYISPGRTVTEADVVNFSGLSGDFYSLHSDEEFAKETRFGRRIAQGALTFAFMTGFWMRLGVFEGSVKAFYGVDKLRFIKPVFLNDTISLRCKVVGKEKRGDEGMILLNNEVLNQRKEVVMSCLARLLLKRGKSTSSS